MVIAHANGTRLRDLTLDSFFFATLAIDKERKNREREREKWREKYGCVAAVVVGCVCGCTHDAGGAQAQSVLT